MRKIEEILIRIDIARNVACEVEASLCVVRLSV